MKSFTSLRFLCVMSFLLLVCPFYDSCNGHGFKKTEEVAVESPVESITNVVDDFKIIESNTDELAIEEQVVLIETNIFEIFYNSIDDKDSQNAYEFACIFFDLFDSNFQDLKKNAIEGIKNKNFGGLFFNIKNISFLLIIIFTILNFILSFTKKIKLVFKFSEIILILLSITIVCLFLEGFFEEISQIKWGYYSFVIVTILIFINCRKLLKSTISSPDFKKNKILNKFLIFVF